MFRHTGLRKKGAWAARAFSPPVSWNPAGQESCRRPVRRPFDPGRARTRPVRAVAEARPVEIVALVTVAFPCSGPWRSGKSRMPGAMRTGLPVRAGRHDRTVRWKRSGVYGGSDRGRTPGAKARVPDSIVGDRTAGTRRVGRSVAAVGASGRPEGLPCVAGRMKARYSEF